jgi:lysophospholipid acyltransferase (LPLAT)-like uncharacterized protein
LKLYRRILQQPPVRRVVASLIAGIIRLIYVTSRWQFVRPEISTDLLARGRSYIACFWHGRVLMMNLAWQSDTPFYMLSSPHADGRLTTAVMGHFGIDTVTGSTRKGGSGALRQLTRLLRKGASVGITPDGPRGPRMRVSMGVIVLAKMSGAPLVPTTFSARPRKVLGTWDRFVMAFPFGRGVFLWGEPVFVANDADPAAMEAARLLLEERMNALCDEGDRMMGVAPIEPAPAAVEPEAVA